MKSLVKSKVDVPELVERRHNQIVIAALELFGKNGYHSTTIREIAERADVSIGLIYQYVEDKEDILFLALMSVLEGYNHRIADALENVEQPLERLRTAIRAYCGVNDEMATATILAYRETSSLSREYRDLIKQKEIETNRLIEECIYDCIRSGLIMPMNVELVSHHLTIFSHAWALKAWRLKSVISLDDYVDSGLRLILGGILTPSGREEFDKQIGRLAS